MLDGLYVLFWCFFVYWFLKTKKRTKGRRKESKETLSSRRLDLLVFEPIRSSFCFQVLEMSSTLPDSPQKAPGQLESQHQSHDQRRLAACLEGRDVFFLFRGSEPQGHQIQPHQPSSDVCERICSGCSLVRSIRSRINIFVLYGCSDQILARIGQ